MTPTPVSISQWEVHEIVLSGPVKGNPFVDVTLSAQYTMGSRVIVVPGFYDGQGTYRVRFLADREGVWTYKTVSNVPDLDGQTGALRVTGPLPGRHGPVRVSRQFHFAHEDGTPYIPVGTTCYAWTHQDEALELQTLSTLKTSPFNKLRMCLFPKSYDFNTNEPRWYPFEGTAPRDWDEQRPNPAFFRHLEARIVDLDRLGIQADLILFHPYDRWGFSSMTAEADDFYLRYVTARLAAFPNLWWSLCNEFDLMPTKTEADWERFAKILQENDPWNHLRSIHNCVRFYDHLRPWITHASVQRVDVYKTSENTAIWRDWWRKPVVVDECGYEGDINWGWGNLTGEEMTRRCWEGAVRGGYVGHGETYLNGREELWWSKGGVLVGSSPPRIAFLRRVMEEGPRWEPLSLGPGYWDLPVAGVPEEYYLFYFGMSQIRYRDLDLPETHRYHIDLLDTWNQTVTPVEGLQTGRVRIELPGRPYMAVRAVRKD